MTNKYFKWIREETKVCKTFQEHIHKKRPWVLTFLKKRASTQASIDFLWHMYDKETKQTITELAVEVRTLSKSKEEIEKEIGYIEFPISKLNEMMKFRRMWKDSYIVYKLKDKVYYLSWEYYLKHNFEINLKKWCWNYLKLPIKNFILCRI